MSDKIEFRENPYQTQMDRIWINDRCAKTDLARWAFDDLPEDKKERVYSSLKAMYDLGFERGGNNKSLEIKKLFDNIKQALN